jgi:predicted O-methyltransferase YrrM
MKTLGRVWTSMGNSDAIPQCHPPDVWPGIETVTAQVRLNRFSWALRPAEQAVLDAVVRFTEPRTIFEFGTATGDGAVLLADAAPDGATVHTVDVPDQDLSANGPLSPDMIGRQFRSRSEYTNRIVQHRVDLASFDATPYRSAVDLVFVDDGHTYDDVTRDSRLALEMVAPGGCIIWDDYGPPHDGAIRALNELSARTPLVRIRGTCLIAHLRVSA